MKNQCPALLFTNADQGTPGENGKLRFRLDFLLHFFIKEKLEKQHL